MRLKNLAVAFLVCVGALTSRASLADTLKLESVSNQSVGGVSIYPYNLSFNGGTTTAPMMCINYDRHVTVGETWQVTTQVLDTLSSSALQADAWLFSQLGKGTYTDSDIQFAVWDILDAGVGGNPGLNSVARSLVDKAIAAVPGLTNSFLSQYTILSPVTTQQAMKSWTDGTPQSFIVSSAAVGTAVTPEPSSLFLLGTGLSGAAVLLMRRRALQEQVADLA